MVLIEKPSIANSQKLMRASANITEINFGKCFSNEFTKPTTLQSTLK